MREQRRRMPKVVSSLEMLDDRIVPSAIHPAIHASAIHAHAHHARMHVAHHVATGSAITSSPTTTSAQSSVSTSASPATVTSATGGGYNAFIPSNPTPVVTTPTVTPSMTDVKSGSLAKAGQALITIYEAFQQGGAAALTSNGPGSVMVQGTNVGIAAHMASGGNFGTYVSSLVSQGMQIRAQDSASGTVEGLLPINQLVAVAQNQQTLSISPTYNPMPRF